MEDHRQVTVKDTQTNKDRKLRWQCHCQIAAIVRSIASDKKEHLILIQVQPSKKMRLLNLNVPNNITGASLVAQMVKHLTTVWETWVRSLGQEDPLEKEMATHSSIHAWKITWTEEPGRLQSMGSQRVVHD